ncbi:hypothetical protein KCP76_04225 [Salmonella enterica subsp. enterica serovar Weltevreden]|nr:hypothetical protein KCP76_04225 [Salmonella enterica subsp. enterica serovar Weltevreden]
MIVLMVLRQILCTSRRPVYFGINKRGYATDLQSRAPVCSALPANNKVVNQPAPALLHHLHFCGFESHGRNARHVPQCAALIAPGNLCICISDAQD